MDAGNACIYHDWTRSFRTVANNCVLFTFVCVFADCAVDERREYCPSVYACQTNAFTLNHFINKKRKLFF